MMKTRIFYTTNAGLYFCSEKSEILIDGIHDAGSVGFYPMSEEMKRQTVSEQGLFVGSGTLLFTHVHKDHYDETAVNEYLQKHPDTAVWGPLLESRGITDIVINNDISRFRCGDFSIIAYNTKHSGPRCLDIPHRSILLRNETNGEAFFVAGDATFEKDLAHEIRKETAASPNGVYAFVMAYQLAEKKSRAFIEALAPSRVFLIHKPRPEDEAFSKVSRIMSFAISETPDGVNVEEPEPMSWIM